MYDHEAPDFGLLHKTKNCAFLSMHNLRMKFLTFMAIMVFIKVVYLAEDSWEGSISLHKLSLLIWYFKDSSILVVQINGWVLLILLKHMLFQKVLLKNFAIFTGKHLCWSLFLDLKLQVFRPFFCHEAGETLP